MTDPIKTRPDGSIDIQHYIARGRYARSVAAHDMARQTYAAMRPAKARIGTVILAGTALVLGTLALMPALI